nr:sigma-54-dependent Fis family transcriptional regulator [Desulfobacula sp.]
MEYVRFFENLGFLVEATPDGSDAFSCLAEKKPDITIADLSTPGFSPVDFLKKINESALSCHILMITADPVVEHAVTLMKLGAFDYLIKPFEMEQLDLCVRSALARLKIKSGPEPAASQTRKAKIITRNGDIQKLLALAERVAKSSASVLIQGESGTGKELFAKYIHEKSDRVNKPFVAVNCAALPENLLESELFGHEKGAFTGAISRKIGKFELAHRGTLFLDEITEMQFHLQAKLLRVLQEKVLDRVGGIEPVEVDVRVIATTNREAKEAVENGDFREDLFYRLNTIPLVIPPLRHRRGDIEMLALFFIQKYCKIDGRHVKGLTKQAGDILNNQLFPGNVRELENIIHRAVLLADSDLIEPENLMLDALESEDVLPASIQGGEYESEPGSLRDMEQKMIYKALDQTEGNRTHAAKILGISVRTLRNKLNEYKENN